MRTVQLDKNAGSKKLRDACNDEKIVRCILLPMDIRDASDNEVLEFAITNGYLTLTFDRPFVLACAPTLARSQKNPGILLLRADEGSVQQMNTKVAQQVLGRFKLEFPEWHVVPWEHTYVELSPALVSVYHTLSGLPRLVALLDRRTSGWQAELKKLLETIAGKSAEQSSSLSPPTNTPHDS